MRKADIDHAWQECRQTDRAQLCISFLEADHEEGGNTLTIQSRITSFIGPNGAGKTDFLNALHATFAGRDAMGARMRISKASGNFRGQLFTIEPGYVMPPAEFVVEFVDASLEVHTIRKYIGGQAHLDELLAQYETYYPNQAQLEIYRHVCGRRYDSFSVLEIEAPAIPAVSDEGEEEVDEIVYPFFEVEIGQVRYDSRTMGFGEFCACYLVWRIHRARKGTAVLLDEPDSHLSPASRRALLDAMALLAKERQLWIGFTTHSLELLEGLRESEIFLVLSDTAGHTPRISPIQQKRHAVRTLGLAQVRQLLIVVEDVDAMAAVWYMINRWGSDIANSVDVQIVSGGAEEVRRFVEHFPAAARICQVVAVLDGDKRSEDVNDASANVFYLPGNSDPVQAARLIVNQDCMSFAALLGVDPAELRQTLLRIAHVNHHDFLARLLIEQHLEGKTVPDVRSALMNAWLSSPPIVDEARVFIQSTLVSRINAMP